MSESSDYGGSMQRIALIKRREQLLNDLDDIERRIRFMEGTPHDRMS
jgi:hypothetical protein